MGRVLSDESVLVSQTVNLLTPLEGPCVDVGIVRKTGGAATLCGGCSEKLRPGMLELYRKEFPETPKKKANCYECKYQGGVGGSAHSSCRHPSLVKEDTAALEAAVEFYQQRKHPLGVTGDPHGIRSGWFNWPIDFDPVWLLSCDGFEGKG